MQKMNQGFTLIEVILVLMIIVILSAFLISKSMNNEPEIVVKREVIKNHIRYSQLMAMKSNTVCGINFNASTYSIFRNGSTADKITLPNQTGTDLSIPAGLGTTTEIIYFDLWGIPYTDLTLTSPRTTGAIGSLGITLTADTGYVL
jgi:prepilin-type N-terminal cleavage/methylation domain-containing protein